MGIIVTENVPLDMGLSIDKYYASLGTNEARVQKRVETNREYDAENNVTESTTTEYVIEGFFHSGCLRKRGMRVPGPLPTKMFASRKRLHRPVTSTKCFTRS